MLTTKKPKYEDYTCVEDYQKDNLKWVVPMTAKEIVEEEEQNALLNGETSEKYIVEEKFDGTRATLHFRHHSIRVFSRRVSEKTGWFCENSDLVPHIRDLDVPSLRGTILDGEMLIPNQPFKAVSSTLNCTYDKAIQRQEELGKIVLNAFDIICYKGIDMTSVSLRVRKMFLHRAIQELNSPYVVEVPYFECGNRSPVKISQKFYEDFLPISCKYPELKEKIYGEWSFYVPDKDGNRAIKLTAKEYYEYIVASGGEGVMLKPLSGIYEGKRSKAYLKIKKFFTREVVILDFGEPTREYTGKFPNFKDWEYWEAPNGMKVHNSCSGATEKFIKSLTPVTKNYFYGLVGNIVFGVVFAEDDKVTPKIAKRGKFVEHNGVRYLEVGECSGFDDEMRSTFSKNKEDFLFTTIEVKANEIFKDTGKLRHPRFLRVRKDKSPKECTWKDHVNF